LFLEEAARELDNAARLNDSISFKSRNSWTKLAKERDIFVHTISPALSRHRINTTHIKNNTIYWSIEWILPDGVCFVQHSCSEDESLLSFVKKWEVEKREDRRREVEHSQLVQMTLPLTLTPFPTQKLSKPIPNLIHIQTWINITLRLKKPFLNHGKQEYVNVEVDSLLKDVLRNQVVLEYPSFVVAFDKEEEKEDRL
jgi:hypothetical protein